MADNNFKTVATEKENKASTPPRRYRTLAVIDDNEDLSYIHSPACHCGSNPVRRKKHEDAIRLYRAKKQAREQGVTGVIFVRSEDLEAKVEDPNLPLPYNHPDATFYYGRAFRERLAELSNDWTDYAELLDDAIRNPGKWQIRASEWADLLKFAVKVGCIPSSKAIEEDNDGNKNGNDRAPVHFHLGWGQQPAEIEMKRVNRRNYGNGGNNDD